MRQCHDFSVTQILREINFEESGSSKIDFFAILGALNFENYVHFSLQKVPNGRFCSSEIPKIDFS